MGRRDLWLLMRLRLLLRVRGRVHAHHLLRLLRLAARNHGHLLRHGQVSGVAVMHAGVRVVAAAGVAHRHRLLRWLRRVSVAHARMVRGQQISLRRKRRRQRRVLLRLLWREAHRRRDC